MFIGYFECNICLCFSRPPYHAILQVSAQLGGAVYNASPIKVSDTALSETTAGEGALTIHDEGAYVGLENVTFNNNALCPTSYLWLVYWMIARHKCFVPLIKIEI